jgi:hypothetical protein
MSSANDSSIERLTRRVLQHFTTITEQMEFERHDQKQLRKRVRIAAKFVQLQKAIAETISPSSTSTLLPPTSTLECTSELVQPSNTKSEDYLKQEKTFTAASAAHPFLKSPQSEPDTRSRTYGDDGASDDSQDSTGPACSVAHESDSAIPTSSKHNLHLSTPSAPQVIVFPTLPWFYNYCITHNINTIFFQISL